jgi:hypothetical protein
VGVTQQQLSGGKKLAVNKEKKMVSFTWQVVPTKLEDSNGLNQVVKTLMLNLICDEEPDIRRVKTTVATLNSPSADSFVEFSQLTEQQVLDWGLTQLGEEQITSMKDDLLRQVEMIKNTRAVAEQSGQTTEIIPPWVTPSST